ncbi:hypothetical protein T439DRAFT_173500 [Meredithblackwellia eburnea MCA 4105]
MDYFVPKLNKDWNFSNSTLILPQPSLASLPQLATDLIVHNLGFTSIGYLGLPDYIPAVSGVDSLEGDPQQSPGLSFPNEVYQNSDKTVTIALPRSPVIQARKRHHAISIQKFVESSGFKDVLLVTTVDAASRGDEGFNEPSPFRHFILPSHTSVSSTPLIDTLAKLFTPYLSSSAPPTTPIPQFPHGGLTRLVLTSFYQSQPSTTIPIATLIIYASEGDNSSLAEFLAEAVSRTVGLAGEGEREWRKPKSWEVGLMGQEMSDEVRGEMFG